MSRNAIRARTGLTNAPRANPTVTFTSVDPVTGQAGDDVIFYGSGFTTGLNATFGTAALSSLTVTSATTAIGTVPTNSDGTYDVTVRLGGHTPSTLEDRFVYQASSAYSTPDIIVNESFEADFGGWVTGGFLTPDVVTRDTTHAYTGTYGVKRHLPIYDNPDADLGAGFWYPFYAPSGTGQFNPPTTSPATTYDVLWARCYFYLDIALDGTLKFFPRFQSASFGTHLGGFYFQAGYLVWVFGPEWNTQSHNIVDLDTLTEGWHSLECGYRRNGDAYPNVAILLDGVLKTSGVGNPPTPGSWSGGRLNAGERSSSAKLGVVGAMVTLNGNPPNNIAANCWVDRIALSSLGTIGP